MHTKNGGRFMLGDDIDVIENQVCKKFFDCLRKKSDICQINPTRLGCRTIFIRYCNFKEKKNLTDAQKQLEILVERKKAA